MGVTGMQSPQSTRGHRRSPTPRAVTLRRRGGCELGRKLAGVAHLGAKQDPVSRSRGHEWVLTARHRKDHWRTGQSQGVMEQNTASGPEGHVLQ